LMYVDNLKNSSNARQSSYYTPLLTELSEHATRLQALIDSQQPFAIRGQIDQNGYWVHDLARHYLTLDDITGNVDTIEIRCNSWRNRRLQYESGVDWEIPEHWENCTAFIHGEPGTTLVLLEMPGKASAAAPSGLLPLQPASVRIPHHIPTGRFVEVAANHEGAAVRHPVDEAHAGL
jgi:hypothetical protein